MMVSYGSHLLRRRKIKPSSCKQKGRKLQQLVRDLILLSFPNLEEDDVRSTAMGQGGEDIQLSPKARRVIPYTIECKNVERLNVWKAWEQATNHRGNYEPLLVIKKNRSPTLAVINLEHLLEILNGSYQLQREEERSDTGDNSNDLVDG
jgi:hypothetical protein